MKEEQRQELRRSIQSEIETLKKTIENLENSSKPVPPDDAYGRLSRMEAINSKSISEAGLASARARLPRLQNALEKIDDPDFGICVRCNRSIPPGRVMLVPESTVCVECADR
jgi:DnaK suppressor protein